MLNEDYGKLLGDFRLDNLTCPYKKQQN